MSTYAAGVYSAARSARRWACTSFSPTAPQARRELTRVASRLGAAGPRTHLRPYAELCTPRIASDELSRLRGQREPTRLQACPRTFHFVGRRHNQLPLQQARISLGRARCAASPRVGPEMM